jgi:regulator of protease activity HflC (stomatin/prohibitin superfamily)
MAGISPAILFLIVFLIILASASIKILREYERGVIFRLGRLIGAKGRGLSSSSQGWTSCSGSG